MSGFDQRGRTHAAVRRATQLFFVPSTLALLIGGLYAPAANAATIDYASSSDGNVATPSNWQGGSVPSSTDTANIGQGAPTALTLQNTNLSVQNLVYTAASPSTTLTLSTTGSGSTSLNLGGINNLSSQQQTISASTPESTLNFTGGTVSGNVNIVVNGVFANLNWLTGASSGSAQITTSNGGTTSYNDASAGSSTLVTNGARNVLTFTNGSSAASSQIQNGAGSVLGFNDTSTAGSANINNSGSATFAGASSAANSNILNSGSLTIANAASLGSATVTTSGDTELTGTATASQSIITNTGTLNFHDQTSAGRAKISNAAALTFADQSSAGSAAITNQATGTITFSNTADASGAHIDNLGAINASAMTQTLSIGSLNGSGTLALAASGASLGALSGTDVISGVISGPGGLTKIGTGQLTLTGTNSYTGATLVSSGILALSGSLTSALSVDAQATLMGAGSTNSDVHIAGAGTIQPGAPGAIFRVGGNFSLAPQAILVTTVDPTGASSQISVTGAASIGAASLRVNANGAAASYAAGTMYTVLTAQQGVTGTFGAVSTNLALLAPHVSYGANDVLLSFTQLQATGGGSATGVNGMVGVGSGPSGNGSGAGTLTAALDGLTGVGLASALNSLGASSYGAIRQIDLLEADDFARKIADHQFAASTSGQVAGQDASRNGWLEIQTAHSALGDDARSNQSGVIGGATLLHSETGTLGLVAQILHGGDTLGPNDATSDRFDIGISMLRTYQAWNLAGTLSYGQHHDEVERFIAFGDYVQGPSSHANGDNYSAYAEANTSIRLHDIDVAPYAGLQWTMANDNGFEESRGNATDLLGRARRDNLVSTALGLRLRSAALDMSSILGGTADSRWSAGLAWIHQTGCLDGRVDASFLADPTRSVFMSTASSLGHDRAVANVAMNANWASGWHLQLRVAADAGGAMHGIGGFAGAGYDFN